MKSEKEILEAKTVRHGGLIFNECPQENGDLCVVGEMRTSSFEAFEDIVREAYGEVGDIYYGETSFSGTITAFFIVRKA